MRFIQILCQMKTIKLKNYDFMNFYIILELQPKSRVATTSMLKKFKLLPQNFINFIFLEKLYFFLVKWHQKKELWMESKW